ncbi:hypothetical protein L0664_04085 [Octadecabacter sp. G9-8]|uniref:Uncharacterized protein n=1 Tax=Octadecabacter dasysiphoniae TaxID=2909341 RepID=A0ABS9CSM8_9RHOB|nr:hypothetical protein [Octadecabacter dasysiphoniae]MCF2870237.1 hypothetical protein [Octadecabacter dasysiphoniae]
MRQPLRKFRKLTEGERARALAFILVGICSAGLGYLAVLHLDRGALFAGLSWYQTWIVVASGLGGLVSLFLAGDRMGQSGAVGALRGAAGAIWVTFIGALIGGTLALPFYGTMFGPFIVTVTLFGAPLLAMLWAFNLFGVHMLLGIYQRERDSIFTPSRMTLPDHPESLRPRFQGRMG